MKIVLPWPDKRLNPNARLHWRAKVGPKQSARIAAEWATAAAKGYRDTKEALAAHDGPIPVEMRFYPPDRRHRDDAKTGAPGGGDAVKVGGSSTRGGDSKLTYRAQITGVKLDGFDGVPPRGIPV